MTTTCSQVGPWVGGAEGMKDVFGTSGGEVHGLCQSLARRCVAWADVDPSPVLPAHGDREGLGDIGRPASPRNLLADGGRKFNMMSKTGKCFYS